jgi:phosphate:Na+ symporter
MIITLGGIGLFLLGMVLLTDGIKVFAGTALREILKKYIRGPISGMVTGTGLTALLQSSSATMLTTIGFVSAGLITFPQALGVIFGANLGTTSTGWLVSILGFKLSIGAAALPLIFVGAMLRLLTKGRVSALGTAIAGFGLLFFGIGMMQEGMGGLSARIDVASFAGEGIGGILTLVLVGIVMTVVMQSSSAAMAITLAALHTGGIDVTQGAAMVIGQNVGTTVTAAMAAIGATNAARRTALAHILFNILTGFIALGLFPLFVWGVHRYEVSSGNVAGVAVLAGFHTAFNIVGVAVFLPAVGHFARLVERLVPEHRSEFDRHLDLSVAGLGMVGIETARRTLIDVLGAFVARGVFVVRDQPCPGQLRQRSADGLAALPKVGGFIARVGTESAPGEELTDQVGLVHVLDHLNELATFLDLIEHHHVPAASRVHIESIRSEVEELMILVESHFSPGGCSADVAAISPMIAAIADRRRSLRAALIGDVARGTISAEIGADLIDHVRWLDTCAYHIGRALSYLVGGTDALTKIDS